MPTFRIKEAASLLGVSDDTLRRWADGGRIEMITDVSGRHAVDGVALAELAQELAGSAGHDEGRSVVAHSAWDRFTGVVSRGLREALVVTVEMQACADRVGSVFETVA